MQYIKHSGWVCQQPHKHVFMNTNLLMKYCVIICIWVWAVHPGWWASLRACCKALKVSNAILAPFEQLRLSPATMIKSAIPEHVSPTPSVLKGKAAVTTPALGKTQKGEFLFGWAPPPLPQVAQPTLQLFLSASLICQYVSFGKTNLP